MNSEIVPILAVGGTLFAFFAILGAISAVKLWYARKTIDPRFVESDEKKADREYLEAHRAELDAWDAEFQRATGKSVRDLVYLRDGSLEHQNIYKKHFAQLEAHLASNRAFQQQVQTSYQDMCQSEAARQAAWQQQLAQQMQNVSPLLSGLGQPTLAQALGLQSQLQNTPTCQTSLARSGQAAPPPPASWWLERLQAATKPEKDSHS